MKIKFTFPYALSISFLFLTTLLNAQIKRAMIRLEDVGPGSYYGTEEGCNKLKAIADYLYSEKIPFQIAMIPRYKNPGENIDHCIADLADPVAIRFVQTLKYCQTKAASVGLHGYTHQFKNAISASGFEFFCQNCTNCPDCPTSDDLPTAIANKPDFESSHVSVRLKAAFEAANMAQLKVDWFETPHYSASSTQVQLIESWSGVVHEHTDRNVRLLNAAGEDAFSNGTLYVPTPLSYISGQSAVTTMCNTIQSYTAADLASFFFHPYLEFPFITLNADGTLNSYASTSFLHQLVSCFKSQNFSFVGINNLYNFIPSKRQTNIGRKDCNLLVGDVNGDGVSELIFHDSTTGKWEVGKNTLVRPPLRVQHDYSITTYLENWAIGNDWHPLVGDFNGDKKEDILVYNTTAANTWQVALSNNNQFIPNAIWLNNWGTGRDWQTLVGDFDGNGKDDVVLYSNVTGDWQVALSTGSSLVPNAGGSQNYHWLSNWGVGSAWKPLVGDFDGNGKEDVLVYNSITGDFQVALSTGSLLVPHPGKTDTYHWQEKWNIGSSWKPLVGDFNGDKKSDIMLTDLKNGNWQISLSTGSYFQYIGTPFLDWGKYPNAFPFIGNFTANGKSSILLWNKDIYNGTIDFALSNVGATNGSEDPNTSNSIAKDAIKDNIILYPNPTKEILNVIFNKHGLKKMAIYNAVGQLILQTETSADAFQLNLHSYQPGVYFMYITHEQGISVQKFIHE